MKQTNLVILEIAIIFPKVLASLSTQKSFLLVLPERTNGTKDSQNLDGFICSLATQFNKLWGFPAQSYKGKNFWTLVIMLR